MIFKEELKRKTVYDIDMSNNEFLLKIFPEGQDVFNITIGMCSCDIYHKLTDSENEVEKINLKYRKPKYKKRGWTDVKIAKMVTEKIKTSKNKINGLSFEFRKFVAEFFLIYGSCSILVHWYSGSIDKEIFSLYSQLDIDIGDLLSNDFGIPEDTLIVVGL